MTYEELLAELKFRKALIVHCSRPGKGDEGLDAHLFPKDMTNAIEICANQKKELSCSVIWPGHIEVIGDIGIVLKPRSTDSVTMICTTDGGTFVDQETGRLVGSGEPFGRQAVVDTFEKKTGHNEWTVKDADTIGVFVKSRNQPLEVATLCDIEQVEEYDPGMGTGKIVGTRYVKLSEIADVFMDLPIYTIEGGEIVNLSTGIACPYA